MQCNVIDEKKRDENRLETYWKFYHLNTRNKKPVEMMSCWNGRNEGGEGKKVAQNSVETTKTRKAKNEENQNKCSIRMENDVVVWLEMGCSTLTYTQLWFILSISCGMVSQSLNCGNDFGMRIILFPFLPLLRVLLLFLSRSLSCSAFHVNFHRTQQHTHEAASAADFLWHRQFCILYATIPYTCVLRCM